MPSPGLPRQTEEREGVVGTIEGKKRKRADRRSTSVNPTSPKKKRTLDFASRERGNKSDDRPQGVARPRRHGKVEVTGRKTLDKKRQGLKEGGARIRTVRKRQ